MDFKSARKDVFEKTQAIIDKHGPRLAGSKADLDAAEDLYQDIKTFADEAHIESFHVYQGAFLGWIRVLVVCFFLSVLALWLEFAWLASALLFAAIMILVLQFFLYLPLLDKFYPKKPAKNVYGIIHPTDEIRQTIIVSGHHDSANIFNFFIHQPELYNKRTTGSIYLVILGLILSLISIFIQSQTFGLVTNIVMSVAFLWIGQMWFFKSKKGTPGAGDNLVASMIAFVLGKHFATQKRLKHTRLIVMSFDAEEEGLRGARAFVKAHKTMLKEHPTYVLNADCLYDHDELFFLTSDLNNFVKLDRELAKDLLDTAYRSKIKTVTQDLAFLTGGTDAAEFAKAGIKATTLIGMPWTNSSRSAVYHTPNDTLEHVEPRAIEDALTIFYQYIVASDKKLD